MASQSTTRFPKACITTSDRQRLGETLWAIADQLRGAMNADDFHDFIGQTAGMWKIDLGWEWEAELFS